MAHVTKLYPTPDAAVFHAFGRVLSGTRKLACSSVGHVMSCDVM